MPVLETRASQSASSRIMLPAGWGAILGFQSCSLAEFGFGTSLPWYGLLWLLLSHILLGITISLTAASRCWWKCGLSLGLIFGIPSALGASALGLRFVPYGIAAIIDGVAGGLLLAVIAKAILSSTSAGRRRTQVPRRSKPAYAGFEERVSYATYRRLAEEKACLEHLDAEREYEGNSDFGKATEDRIVWKELLELELQDIDEQVDRICHASEDAAGLSNGTGHDPGIGRSYGRNGS